MTGEQLAIILAGALIGGFVNGLTGFGSALMAIGIWLHALPAPVTATLAIATSVISQVQALPVIWDRIDWRTSGPYVIPGLIGTPIGVFALALADPAVLKLGIGVFLVLYAVTALTGASPRSLVAESRGVDTGVGFVSGILGGMTGLSGALMAMWTDVRGGSKETRRTLLQVFNLAILVFALVAHAVSGRVDGELGRALLTALPGTIGGAWLGVRAYRALGDRDYRRIVLALLLASGLMLLTAGR
jgi:uncharacterized membrane protein YfcA